jgi:adenylate cyclase class IV
VFLYRGARIHLDRVEGLGTFLEFEVPAGKDGGEESLMRELRALFGIKERDIVALSYADMSELTAKRG